MELSSHLRRISFNFCLTPSNFAELLQLNHNSFFRPLVSKWFDLLKNTANSTVINGLEFVTALAVTCQQGKPLEKTSLVFDIFDFDNSGAITKDELMILLKSSVRGLAKFTVGLGPQLVKLCPMSQIEELANNCFK